MPSKTASKSNDTAPRKEGNFVDEYLADWDDDPFRSPSPDPARNDKAAEKKKDILGIDKELDLKKKPRVPRVKLDENRSVVFNLCTLTRADPSAGYFQTRESPNCERWRRGSR